MGDVEVLGPVADFVTLVHVNLATVRLIAFGEVVCHSTLSVMERRRTTRIGPGR
jgi:hypothetical protein